jgi:Fe-S cluster assembly scaffold protein SufB
MMPAVVRPEEWFRESLIDELSDRFSDPEHVRELRKKAFGTYLELPSEGDPLYKKYSHLAGIDLRNCDPVSKGSPVDMPKCRPGEIVVLHDPSGTRVQVCPQLAGKGVKALSLPDIWSSDLETQSLFLADGNASLSPEKFESMNLALMNRGLYLEIPDRCSTPVRVKEVSVLAQKDEAMVVRRVIHAGALSRVFHSEEVYCASKEVDQRLYSSSTNITSGDDSDVIYFTAHAPDDGVVGFYNRVLDASTNSRISWLFSGVDGHRTTLRNLSRLRQRGGVVNDHQVFFGDGENSVSSFVKVLHEADDTRGRSIARGVFKDHSRGLFAGMMKIDPDVKKIFSYLSEHAMLLSKSARAETIPGLEISSAMDVKASHSSSVAPLDPERIFYVQCRGFDSSKAARLIAEGFLASAMSQAPLEGLENCLSLCFDVRWEGRHMGWAGHHMDWVWKVSTSQGLAEGSQRTSNDLRIDSKLR